MTTGGKPRIQKNDLSPISVGYVMIPKSVDRDGYIKTCYRTNRICVLVEGGLFKTDVYITNEVLPNISFPKEPGEKGTQVVIAAGSFKNQPIIIGTLQGNDETPDWVEEIYRFRKQYEDVTMLMCMDPKNKEWNLDISGGTPVNLNIIAGGNDKHKIHVQTSGEIEIVASKKIKATCYDTMEAEIVNAPVEAEEPGKEKRHILFDMEQFKVTRKTNDKTSAITFDDKQIAVELHDKQEMVIIDDNNIKISYNNGEEDITLSQGLIKLLTKQKVNINGAGEPLTLANTLINLLNNMENQISTLKNAWSTAAGAAVPQDGGKTGLSAGASAVSGVNPLNFDGIKSKVIFSD